MLFLELPSEILEKITQYLPASDVLNLRKTCVALAELNSNLNSHLWKHLVDSDSIDSQLIKGKLKYNPKFFQGERERQNWLSNTKQLLHLPSSISEVYDQYLQQQQQQQQQQKSHTTTDGDFQDYLQNCNNNVDDANDDDKNNSKKTKCSKYFNWMKLYSQLNDFIIHPSTCVEPVQARKAEMAMAWGPRVGGYWKEMDDPDSVFGKSIHLKDMVCFFSVDLIKTISTPGNYSLLWRLRAGENACLSDLQFVVNIQEFGDADKSRRSSGDIPDASVIYPLSRDGSTLTPSQSQQGSDEGSSSNTTGCVQQKEPILPPRSVCYKVNWSVESQMVLKETLTYHTVFIPSIVVPDSFTTPVKLTVTLHNTGPSAKRKYCVDAAIICPSIVFSSTINSAFGVTDPSVFIVDLQGSTVTRGGGGGGGDNNNGGRTEE